MCDAFGVFCVVYVVGGVDGGDDVFEDAANLFGANGDQIGSASIFGISLIVFLTDLAASILLIVVGIQFFRSDDQANPNTR